MLAGMEAAARQGDSASSAVDAAAGAVAEIAQHRGWAPAGGRRRWMEPFVLMLLAEGRAHGYAIMGALETMGISSGPIDIGQVYRTLRELEASGEVTSSWSSEPVGPQRREYELTDAGFASLAAWAAVMRDRGRLIDEFETRYRETLANRESKAEGS
jgi:PadR family transcriptional regulator PadR